MVDDSNGVEQAAQSDAKHRPWTRRALLASFGAAGAALAAGTGFRLSASGADSQPNAAGYAYSVQSGSPTSESCAHPQSDFVGLLQSHNETATVLYAKATGDRMLEVLVPFKGKRCAHYTFGKDLNDDYIRLLGGAVSLLDQTDFRISALDYNSKTGVWVTGYPPNEYTTETGTTFSFSFHGTGFDFQHYADTRGGVWEFAVDGAVMAAVSTHLDAVPAGQLSSFIGKRPIARGLANGVHSVVATFKGDDPEHAPSSGAGTARGWVRNAANYSSSADTYRTAIIYGEQQLNPDKLFDVLHPLSNKEFAIRVSPAGSGYTAHWLPEHSGVGTVFAVSQRVYFDDEEITDWTPDAAVRPVRSVKIVQRLVGKHPSDPGSPVAEIDSVHTVSASGAAVKTKIKWLRAVTISAGYGMMFPAAGAFARTFATSLGGVYDASATDGSKTDLAENDQAASYAFVHDDSGVNGESDTVVAMTVHDIAKTFRYEQPGRWSSGSVVWLQHRDTNVQKLYPHVYDRHTVPAGETYEAGGVYVIGELPLASRFYG